MGHNCLAIGLSGFYKDYRRSVNDINCTNKLTFIFNIHRPRLLQLEHDTDFSLQPPEEHQLEDSTGGLIQTKFWSCWH